jgi:hypothetical protein
MQTYTGAHFHLAAPRVEDVFILDIAHALSLINRFTGHSTVAYSVAQHSCLVSQNVPTEDALWGLLHDAAEAYTGDIGRPLKETMRTMGGIALDHIERDIMLCICKKFDLPLIQPPSVKKADLILLSTERRDLMGDPQDWIHTPAHGYPCLEAHIEPWSADLAETRFLRRFKELHP